MQSVPQIVRERLKAGVGVTTHPDANILAAFAEQALLEAERAHVLAHLAACTDCRNILALALPGIDTNIVMPVSVAVGRSWFTWPVFRWGFATAGVALIGLGVVEFQHYRPVHSAMFAKQIAPVPITAETQKKVGAPSAIAPQQASASKVTAFATKGVHPVPEAKLHLERKLATPLPKIFPALKAQASTALSKQGPANAPVPPASSQMVAIEAQNVAVDTQAAASQPFSNPSAEQFSAYNSGPMSRAKPADIQPVQADVVGSLPAMSRWSITGVGGLQRSYDQGKTWQDVSVSATTLPAVAGAGIGSAGGPTNAAKQNSVHGQVAAKMSAAPIFFRAVTAAGNEVWAGGSNAALFHSTDGGNHWARVLPSSPYAVLTGDILSVEFSDLKHGTVTTSTPEIWTTADDGQNWQKQ